jgi:muramoyltetrapeptide carboxypeptidase LdcA involved in peptidoglycan recycling
LVADWWRFAEDPQATVWKQVRDGTWTVHGADSVRVTGRLIGGCVETVCNLAGTPYGDVAGFGGKYADDGLIVYLEAAGDEAATICRSCTAFVSQAGSTMRGRFSSAAQAPRTTRK